ncbi:PREDICTED: carbonic anhydrase 1-like [Trachymyrmex septentrionalis]|uniref:carbonic anhydrase 1-like n=1 Tax=Trachymyrmex septentrionalis TaxID=34720 RepID=UPI00084F40E7|nr:PREDICTED: carbonic anhydrase 1-like [Trachymyrmex septentrionalis]
MIMVFSIIYLSFLFLPGFCRGQNFGYDGDQGPANWSKEYHTCIGKHQSPINIDEHNVTNVSLPSLRLIGIDNPHQSYVTNTGHTVTLKTNESKAVMLSGGPLKDTYVFEQLHFHWGENDFEGSEDLINNHSFPMEMHAVFYKEDYKSFKEALNYSDGLAILAYLYEVSPQPNPTYEPIVKVLPDIEKKDMGKVLQEPLLLESIFVPDIAKMQDYFTYSGSLTTPPCLEVAKWIDFKDHQQLSHDQLAAFRDIRNWEGNKLTHNFRPVQPLEDREVFHNIPSSHNSNEHSGQRSVKVPILFVALGALVAIFLFAI